jgi:hypothetical protein
MSEMIIYWWLPTAGVVTQDFALGRNPRKTPSGVTSYLYLIFTEKKKNRSFKILDICSNMCSCD